MRKELVILPFAALATIALLPLNQKLAPLVQLPFSGNPAVNRMAAAQLLTLGLVLVVLAVVRWLNIQGFRKYWRLGDFAAPASGVRWLGIQESESWRSVGIGFGFVITAVTGTFMWFGVYQKTQIAWLEALPWVFIFSVTNSFSEEILCRFSLVATLDKVLSKQAICWWSAAIFGGVHFFGTPGGIAGVLMAGFLGWLLAKSMVETQGIAWAWLLHFLQDMVIIFALVGATSARF